MREIVRHSALGMASVTLVWLLACRSNPPVSSTPPPAPVASSTVSPALDRVTMTQDPAPLGVGSVYTLPSFPSIDNVQADAASLIRGKSVMVVAMTSSGCPVSQKYAPRIAAIEREFAPRGVTFLHVNTVAAESDAEIREHIKDAGLRGTYAPDRDRALARVLRPRTTSEVYVFDSTWTLRYRGALDDQFGVGVALQSPRRHFLREAIEATLTKQPPNIAATWAPGCLVDPPDSPRNALFASEGTTRRTPSPSGVTYYNRIAHILDAHCLDCHRTNGPAPFNLASASSIEGRAAMIAAVVRDGLMPPSHGPEQSQPAHAWKSPVAIPEQDRADLLAWLSSDRPLGDPSDAPKPNPRPQGWTLGTPEQFLMTETLRLPADGSLMHQRSAIPTSLNEDLWLRAIELRPMKQGTIERAIAWVLPPGTPTPRAEDDLSGIPGIEFLAAYNPGHGFVAYPPSSARRLRAGCTVIVDLYARPMGQPMGVALRIGLHTRSRMQVTHEVRSATLIAAPFEIGANESAKTVLASREWPQDALVLGITPAMGPRGKEIVLRTDRPSGTPSELLHLSRFDARWAIRYEPAELIPLNADTTLVLEGRFDNSEANPSNPTPGLAATSGAAATQESLWAGVEYLVSVDHAAR